MLFALPRAWVMEVLPDSWKCCTETKGHGWNTLLWAIYPLSFRHWVIHRWYTGRLWGSSLWIHQERKLFMYRQWKCSYKTARWPSNASSHWGSNQTFRYSTCLNNYCYMKWTDQNTIVRSFLKEKKLSKKTVQLSNIQELRGFWGSKLQGKTHLGKKLLALLKEANLK